MTFGPDVVRYCMSTISTPVKVHAYVTSSYALTVGGTVTSTYTTAYEYVQSSFTGTPLTGRGNGYSTWTVSNITTITSALAVADPIIVAWQLKDLSSFPAPYATSIANKIGVTAPTVQETPTLPRETGASPGTPSTPQAFSTPAKVGIGIGSVAGALLILAIIILLCWKTRRKATPAPVEDADDVPEMEDQDTDLAKRKWFLSGRWRNEAQAEGVTQELDSRTIHVIPGPPAELEAYPMLNTGNDAPVRSTGRIGD
jgi:hypothetical protein